MKNNRKLKLLVAAAFLTASLNFLQVSSSGLESYTVKSGDTLWKISNNESVSINDIKLINGLSSDYLSIGQILKLKPDSHVYAVKAGDSLWGISVKFNTSVSNLKLLNGLTSDTIYSGQALKTMPDTVSYTVKSGDTLYKLATAYGTTVADIKSVNKLTYDAIYVGQKLLIPYKLQAASAPAPSASKPMPVVNWPSITYIVQAGDNVTSISKKFNVSASDILKYNYMTDSDWFNAGEKIAINGYAPRNYSVVPGQDSAPTQFGNLVDWFLDGKYLLKRNAILTITDLQTGKSFKVKIMGGYNHADTEPLTSSDTNVMKQLWTSWSWTPRPVVIYKDGMNIAASLSGMPHSYDTTPDNGVTGHFDLYLQNSIPHGAETSQTYVNMHYANINKAAGIQK